MLWYPPIFTHQFEKTYSFHQIVHTNFPKYSFHQIMPKYSFHQFEPTGKSSDVLNIQWHFFKKMPWSIVHYYSSPVPILPFSGQRRIHLSGKEMNSKSNTLLIKIESNKIVQLYHNTFTTFETELSD